MLKLKTTELMGPALDWAVAKAEGYIDDPESWLHGASLEQVKAGTFKPSTNWSQGGPLIEREAVSLTQFSDHPKWTAKHPASVCFDGPTPLIAAMRCLVASKLGDTVQVPKELLP